MKPLYRGSRLSRNKQITSTVLKVNTCCIYIISLCYISVKLWKHLLYILTFCIFQVLLIRLVSQTNNVCDLYYHLFCLWNKLNKKKKMNANRKDGEEVEMSSSWIQHRMTHSSLSFAWHVCDLPFRQWQTWFLPLSSANLLNCLLSVYIYSGFKKFNPYPHEK